MGARNIFKSKIKRIRYPLYSKNLYVIYHLSKQYLNRNYRFFDQFLYLKYCLRRLFFTSTLQKNALSSQQQVPWKQYILHLWWNNIKFWFRLSLSATRWQISPSVINSSTELYHTWITLILMLSAIVSLIDLIIFYFGVQKYNHNKFLYYFFHIILPSSNAIRVGSFSIDISTKALIWHSLFSWLLRIFSTLNAQA